MRKLSQAKLRAAAQILASHGATEVYLFGSYAEQRAKPGSDADFAVVGLADDRFFRAMGEAMESLGRPLDLINLEDNTPLSRHLKSEGTLVRLL